MSSPATAPATQLVEWTSADGKVSKVPPSVRYALDAKYRGQKFGDTALAILGFFDEKAILKPTQRKVDDGSPHDPHELTAAANVVTVLTLKDDPSKSWSCAAGRIICTRLLEHVLASAKVPDDKKLQLVDTAKTSAASKKWKAEYDEKRAIVTAPTEEKKLSAAELEALTPAERNARRRQQTLHDRTVQKLSAAQVVAIHYALVTFFFICHIPFAVIEHWAFVALVDALCPAYTSQLFGRHALSSTWLGKLYDETFEKIESKLDQAMGRKTAIIDGFKDVRK